MTWEPTERYWVYWWTDEQIPHRSGFVDTLEGARQLKDEMLSFEHINKAVVEKIEPVS